MADVTGAFDDPIQCSLEEHALDQKPKFHAISDKVLIACDGHQLNISQNLHGMLQKLRRDKKERSHVALWTDGICINQQNIEEKTFQARIMGDIYAQAQCVIVWLGHVAKNNLAKTAIILELIWQGDKDIAKFEERFDATGDQLDDLVYRSVEAHSKKMGTEPFTAWLGIMKILMIDLFNRVWVIQEFVQAESVLVYLDEFVLEWRTIFRFAAGLYRSLGWGIIMAPYARHLDVPNPVMMIAASFWPLKATHNHQQPLKLHENAFQTTTFGLRASIHTPSQNSLAI
jgi:hypothetical protein